MSNVLRAAGTALVLAMAPVAASAVIVEDTELDDAGGSFDTAMVAGGIEVTGIAGFLGEGGNDLFRFEFLFPVTFQVSNMAPDIAGDLDYDSFDVGFGPRSASVEYCFDCYYKLSGPDRVAIGPITVGPGVYYLGIADVDEYDALPIENYSMDISITAAVPLPGALALLGGGLAAMGVVGRKRRKA